MSTVDKWPVPHVPEWDLPSITSVLDAVSVLVVVVEPSTGSVVYVNSVAQEIIGWSAEELLGHRWWDLVEEHDREGIRAMMQAPAEALIGFETSIATKDGDRRRVLWSLARGTRTAVDHGPLVLLGLDVTPTGSTHGLFSHVLRGSATPAFVGTDARGRVTLYSYAAEQMLGIPASEMLGQLLPASLFETAELEERANTLGIPADIGLLTHDLSRLERRQSSVDLGPLDRRRRSDQASADLETGRPEKDRRAGRMPNAHDWTLIRAGGERFTASLVVVPVSGPGAETVAFLGIAEDVTEQRRSRNLLIASLEKEAEAVRHLQELARAKSEFIATVSHELRTPITSIVGYIELMLETPELDLPAAQRDMLVAVQRNGERLRALADDLLTLSSFDAGEFAMHTGQVDLCEVVTRAEEALRPYAVDRLLEVHFDVPSDAVMVEGDATHLERVVFNLLSNALKFTEDGGRVSCTLGIHEGTAVVEVADNGIGIPVTEQAQLFTKFFRASTAQKREIPGTGIGLAVVAAIVERHAGTIEIASAEGRGTSVTVRLPLV